MARIAASIRWRHVQAWVSVEESDRLQAEADVFARPAYHWYAPSFSLTATSVSHRPPTRCPRFSAASVPGKAHVGTLRNA